MAVTSIWPIKGRVDKVINYTRNPEKTHDKEKLSELHEIEGVVEYAADEMKTEKRAYVTCLNLHSEETAAQEFMETKRLMHNEGGRSCYHGYQSFKADEVDKPTSVKKVSAFLREDVTKLDRYMAYLYSVRNEVYSIDESSDEV